MIRRIFLDVDDVCNTLAPFVLNAVGCDIDPTDYTTYPRQFGYAVVDVANFLLRKQRYTPATFWASMPGARWAEIPETGFFHWLLDTCAEAVGRENVCIASGATKSPESLSGKLEWIHHHFPSWMHRQYIITPRKHLLARPDSLLIDDYHENTERFEVHGGHAILVPRPWNDNWLADPRRYLEENLAIVLQKAL